MLHTICRALMTGVASDLSQVVIAPGDRLSYSTIQLDADYGGLALIFTDGTGSGDATDITTGIPLYDNPAGDVSWHFFTASLDEYAGKQVSYVLAGIHSQTPAGPFDLWIDEAVITRANGSVLPIFVGQGAGVPAFSGNGCGAHDMWNRVELGIPSSQNGVNYYLDDHLGTAQMELSGSGWPVWEGQFTPFGQELDNGLTAMHYKFTGKERDTESGLDYFGARYYASSLGRFMSPDWAAQAEPVPYAKLDNPQSLNLYGYVLNNPLSKTDTDGHSICDSSGCREAAFAAEHPWIARQVGPVFTALSPIGLHSTNLSTDAVRFSTGMGLSENATHEGSEVNAMRHTTWSATITSQYGAGVAKQIGDAHEENPNVDLSVRTFTGKGAMDQADQSVDLLNNQIGRSIGDANPGASMNQLAGAALDYYHSTGLYTASRNGDGSVSISQTKLSDQQYNAAKDQLKKMDKDGFQH